MASTTTIEDLPGHVLSDIFMQLLAKQLAQMGCVCKLWNALLSDSSFIKSQLRRSIHKKDDIFYIFSHRDTFECSTFTARPSRSPYPILSFTKLPVDPQYRHNYGKVIGSVNGLICFYYQSHKPNDVVYMWNPSLSAVLTLPPCSLPFAEGNHYRFGYDPKNDDYKVVKLTCLFGQFNVRPEVEVYSMRKGSWELITQRFPSHITMIREYDHVCTDGHDGHLHWLVFTGSNFNLKAIVAFDLGAETFREIPLPDAILHHHHGSCDRHLGVLSGKLCVMSRIVPDGEWEVWVMEEYGVADSWVKHHALSQFSLYIEPYGFTSHSEFLFRDGGHFGLYDPMASQTKTFMIGGGIRKVVEYVDSLVWVSPAEHELSKGNLSISISKSHRMLKGLQKAIKGLSRFLFSAVKRETKGNNSGSNSSIFCYYGSA